MKHENYHPHPAPPPSEEEGEGGRWFYLRVKFPKIENGFTISLKCKKNAISLHYEFAKFKRISLRFSAAITKNVRKSPKGPKIVQGGVREWKILG